MVTIVDANGLVVWVEGEPFLSEVTYRKAKRLLSKKKGYYEAPSGFRYYAPFTRQLVGRGV